MRVIFNGQTLNVPSKKQLRELLNEYDFKKTVVVFLNDTKLLMKEVETYILLENDQIRVFRPLSGG